MRILFVSDYPHLPDIKGGLQTTTHDLCLAIATAGAEVAVLCGTNEYGNTARADLTRSDTDLGYLCMRAASPQQMLPFGRGRLECIGHRGAKRHGPCPHGAGQPEN
jgi:hypothetical protein